MQSNFFIIYFKEIDAKIEENLANLNKMLEENLGANSKRLREVLNDFEIDLLVASEWIEKEKAFMKRKHRLFGNKRSSYTNIGKISSGRYLNKLKGYG